MIGVPKTIDNDIPYIDHSFGFQTAFARAAESIQAAHTEASSTPNGVGLVKLMGRHSGFIACYAALANHDVDFVLIPEVPVQPRRAGRVPGLRCGDRVRRRGHAVVVVAEGAGPGPVRPTTAPSTRPATSRLADIGRAAAGPDHRLTSRPPGPSSACATSIPGYAIRSVPANGYDAVYCLRLAQAAVHAGDGRADGDGGRPLARAVRAPADLPGHRQPQPGRPGRRPVDVGARGDRPAAAFRLRTRGYSCCHRARPNILPYRLIPAPAGLVDGVGVQDRRGRRRLEQRDLRGVQVAHDIADGDHRYLVRLDKPQVVVAEPLEEMGRGLVAQAELALDLAFGPASADPHHDALEDVFLFHREDMLQHAELLAVLGQHGDTERDALVRDLEFIVHDRPRYSERRASGPLLPGRQAGQDWMKASRSALIVVGLRWSACRAGSPW